LGVSGRALIAAAVAGYETGVRSGEYLGQSHYKVFHTTGTAGTLAAAAGVAHLLNLSAAQFSHALGSAGTQAAGLWEFLRDAADSKQLHTAKAAADGTLAAYTARDGLTAAHRILEGERGLAAGLTGEANIGSILNDWGKRWVVSETSFKFHASCRHTHPAADAMLAIVADHDLSTDDIVRIRAYVYGAAIDVLGAVVDPRNVHQSKFSMGFVLALIAARRSAAVTDFTEHALRDPLLRRLHGCTEMIYDPDIDAAYPRHWSARVEVDTADGRTLQHSIATPKGDPENALTRKEIETKARSLAAFANGATQGEIDTIIAAVWQLEKIDDINDVLRLPLPTRSEISRRAIPA
ncbi:MAG: MmgE/PrpD family protein, partial [Gammaproteobacteria bacterium]|nr:MmgE/PrpD family protein [Gammaproteobacteria bacterium]